jgi:hypothetical protein
VLQVLRRIHDLGRGCQVAFVNKGLDEKLSEQMEDPIGEESLIYLEFIVLTSGCLYIIDSIHNLRRYMFKCFLFVLLLIIVMMIVYIFHYIWRFLAIYE